MGDNGVKIDADGFCKRLKMLHQHWQANRATSWAGASALAIVVGASSEDLRYLKSISLHLWLFGYELPDTVIVLTQKELHILTSTKKASLLQPLAERCLADCGLELTLLVKPKTEDGSVQMQALVDTIRAAEMDQPTVGTLPKDKHTGKVAELFASTFAAAGLTMVDAALGLADLLSCKDASEILNVKKAGMLASKVMKDYVIGEIESIIDDNKKVKHSKLSSNTEEVITDPHKVNVKLKKENVDIAYPPIFQSGGKYDLKVSVASDDSNLHPGVIVVSIGTRYASYCSNISRTFVINPTKKQEAEYRALLAAHEAVIAALVDGATVASVVEKASEVLRAQGQEHLVERLARSLGFGMGLEFRENSNMLATKNEGTVRAGMVFNVCIGVTGLENPDAQDLKSKVYAFQIADTVIVKDQGKEPDVATSTCPRTWDKVSYTLNENEDGEEGPGGDAKMEDLTNGALPSRKTLRSDDPTYKSAEQIRKEKQEALLRQKNEDTLRRLTAGQADGGSASTSGRVISDVVAYKNVTDMPVLKDLIIQVDSRSEAVLLPIYGVFVPFHITTIKNVTSNQDHDHAYVRVTFNLGGSYEPFVKNPSRVFLKEMSFRSADIRHANKTVQEIKLLRSTTQQRDKERAERANLVAQEKLVAGKRVYKLPDLWIRPNFGGKGRKLPGSLEAHANGFKYSNPKNEFVHVMYRNIKHAFFQPAENDMVTILHFHLINPIMLGNKKTKDVQFYTEVMDVVQTLDGGRRSAYDPDEIEEEQRERERRNKINHEFQQFVKRVQELWERDYPELGLEFDIPFRELGFNGTPHRSAVFIMPTVNCLIELTEMPFTVISIADIELVNLERVGFNLKNFDMAIVLKDFTRDVIRIDAVPAKSLETIKDWLTSVKIKYYENKLNLAWKPILKNIQEDPEGFIEQGGWEFLNMDVSDEEEEGEEQSEDYAPSGGEGSGDDDGSDDDDDSDGASVVDSDDDGSGSDEGGEDEDEEEGLSWEELEAEAKRDDDRRAEDDSDEEGRKGKGGKKRSAGGSGGGGGGGGAAKRRR